MNILQSFMGCMYPGSIRTESIESMEHDYPNSRYQVSMRKGLTSIITNNELIQAHLFQVTNINEEGRETSKGELQLTDKDLIYFIPGKFPTCWRIDCIRRYGCTETGDIFVFESGRSSTTGEATFAFRINRGPELVTKLKEKIMNEDVRTKGILSSVKANHSHDEPSRTNGLTDGEVVGHPSVQKRTDRLVGSRPLSYVLIDFDTTKALNDSAQAHAANRDKGIDHAVTR